MTKIGGFSADMFAFALFLCQLCRKLLTMKQSDFEMLLGRVWRSRPKLGGKVEFSLVCMHAGSGRRAFENRIYSEFGMSGEELVEGLHRTM